MLLSSSNFTAEVISAQSKNEKWIAYQIWQQNHPVWSAPIVLTGRLSDVSDYTVQAIESIKQLIQVSVSGRHIPLQIIILNEKMKATEIHVNTYVLRM